MKKITTIIVTAVLLLIGLFIFILEFTDNRNQLARELDYKPIKDFYYIKDMPYKFHEHYPLSLPEEGAYYSSTYERIYELWDSGENEIINLRFEAIFRFYNDLTNDDLKEQLHGPWNEVTVKNTTGYYGRYTQGVLAIEYVYVLLDGVIYSINFMHTNPQYFGQEYVIDFVNKHLVN